MKEPGQTATILIIDNEEPFRQRITAYLEDHNFHVIETANGRTGLEIFRREKPDLLLIDPCMPEMKGVEVLATVKHEAPQTPLMVISGKGSLADAAEVLRLGRWDYIFKPIQDMPLFLNAVQKALEWARLVQENRRCREHMEEDIARRTKECERINEELIREITERKRVEAEMSRLRNFMKDIIDSMPSVLVGVDLEERVTHWNHQAERTTGVSSKEAQGCKLADVFPQLINHVEKVHWAIQQRTPQKDEKVVSRIDGETRYLDMTVYPLVSDGTDGAVIRIDDVTSRVHIEEMMIQSEKMLSVGGLAAGIAHELNNPLAGMLQNTQVVLSRLTNALPANIRAAEECGISIEAIRRFAEKREIVKMLEMVRLSGQRAAQIVQDMLSFSHKSEHHIFPLHDIRKLLEKSVELAFHIYNLKGKYTFQQIEILQEYDPNLPEVPCEQTEIQQVLLNLLMNAAQAMAGQENRNERPGIILRTAQDGNMLRIEVEDNGPGMPENVRKRVFEPFFTTKEEGVGTGLGLPVSYFIITKNHRGTMSVDSEPGKGTKFIICLPLTRGA